MSKVLATTVADSKGLATIAVLSNNIKRQGLRQENFNYCVNITRKVAKKATGRHSLNKARQTIFDMKIG